MRHKHLVPAAGVPCWHTTDVFKRKYRWLTSKHLRANDVMQMNCLPPVQLSKDDTLGFEVFGARICKCTTVTAADKPIPA